MTVKSLLYIYETANGYFLMEHSNRINKLVRFVSLYKELKMNNKPKYLHKTFSALTLGVILLVNSSLGLAKEVVFPESAQQQSVQVAKQPIVNLNKSTFEQLVTLKGIGQTKAQAIIVYRKQVGAFKSIDELTKVSGIGEKIVNQNKTRLSI